MLLNKEESLFIRDEKGELIPQEVELTLLKDKPIIKAIPLTRGEIQTLALSKEGDTTKDQDVDIVIRCCKEPIYTEEEAKYVKPKISTAIVTAIMALSLGVSQDTFGKQSKQDVIVNEEYQLKKN